MNAKTEKCFYDTLIYRQKILPEDFPEGDRGHTDFKRMFEVKPGRGRRERRVPVRHVPRGE